MARVVFLIVAIIQINYTTFLELGNNESFNEK